MNQGAMFSVSTATARPQAGAAGGGSNQAEGNCANQFSTDLLNALMNRAAGVSNNSVRLANLASGETPVNCVTRETAGGPRTFVYGGVGVGAREADQTGSAEARARDLILALGSDSSLSLSEVEAAMGVGDAACSPRDLNAIRSVIRTNWSELSGGGEMMTVAELTAAIERYQGEV